MSSAHAVQNWLYAATLVSCVVAMIGLFYAVAGQRTQLAVQIMLQYSDRLMILLQGMPEEIVNARRSLTVPESTFEITQHIRVIFYVLLELHYLHRKRYLPVDIWNLWFLNVEVAISSPLFVREWQILRPEFEGQTSFRRFVDSMQKKHVYKPANLPGVTAWPRERAPQPSQEDQA